MRLNSEQTETAMSTGHRRRNGSAGPLRPRRAAKPTAVLEPLENPYDAVLWWRERLDTPRFVYFIQDDEDGPVKIGQAFDPKGRLAELQCGNPRALCLRAIVLATDETESQLHTSWAGSCIRGEWFGGGDEVEILRRACNAQRKQVEQAPDPRMGRAVFETASLAYQMIRCPVLV